MGELYVGSVLVAPIIAGLIEMAKVWFGMPVKYAPLVNVMLTAIAYVGIYVLGMYPGALEPTVIVLNIVIGFLAAVGFYNGYKTTRSG